MLRIAICDDEATARDMLRFQLEKLIREPGEEIVYEFSSGERAARWMKAHPGEVDLLFLDVEMPGKDGLETAAEIRSFDREIFIVFVTGYKDYVFQGYQVDALDYIVKPAAQGQVEKVLLRVRASMDRNKQEYFTIRNTEGTYRFALSKICYFYSEKRLAYLVTGSQEYAFYEKLNVVEETLGGAFIRIHQRYLVNPYYISYLGSESVVIHGQKLPISRSFKEGAVRKLAVYLAGET